MAIRIGKSGDNLEINQNIENSEVDSSVTDIEVEETGDGAKVNQSIIGSVVKHKWFWIITAIGTAVAGIITAYIKFKQ